MPLSVARGARLPGQAWTRRDWLLAQAVEYLDRTRCPGCGQPTWLSHDKTTRGKWVVHATRCQSCEASTVKQKALEGGEMINPQAVHYRTEYAGH